MNAYAAKIRHIMPVFLYVTIGSLVGLCMIRYVFAIQTELLDFKQEVWEIWIPIAFPWIPITIWLRPRFRILLFRKDSDRKQLLFQVLTWGTMVASLVISQMYLTTASGKLQDASHIEELDSMDRSRYYQIRSFETLTSYGAYNADIRPSGKHNEYLNFHLYFVCPIVRDSIGQPKEFKYWYGVSFRKQISNRLGADEKEREYNSFTKECIQKMNAFQFHDVSYFERLPNNEDRDGYLGAVANITKREDNNVVILEPKQGSFDDRNGNKLAWIFGSYLIGTTVILLLLLWPRLSKVELERQWRGKKPQKDEVVDMLKFLIPKQPHFVTSVILDLNILVFIVMVLAGVHIISPNGLELLEWGANRRTETTGGDWWRLISSMFLHGGVMHLILNIYALVLASIFIEPVIGAVRYAILYFVSGIAGSIASIMWYENTVSVGASGAIFGLFGAVLAVAFTGVMGKDGNRLILILFGPYVVINLLVGLTGGIDNAAHIGGLVTGAVVALIIYQTMKPASDENSIRSELHPKK